MSALLRPVVWVLDRLTMHDVLRLPPDLHWRVVALANRLAERVR